MYLGKDPSFKYKTQNNFLLYSPEKTENYSKLEESNFSDIKMIPEQIRPFHSYEDQHVQNENPVNFQDFNYYNSLYPNENHQINTKPNITTSILKLDFLEELIKDDISIKDKNNIIKSFNFDHLNSLREHKTKAEFMKNEDSLRDDKIFSEHHRSKKIYDESLSDNLMFFNDLIKIKSKQNQKTEPKIGNLTKKERNEKIEKYLKKKNKRKWDKKINYGCRKKVADTRLRMKGRFIARKQFYATINNENNDKNMDTQKNL